MKPPKRRKPRRTSDRVSSAAARMMAHFRRDEMSAAMLDNIVIMGVTLRELRSMAASLISQDEHRGPRETKGRK